MAIFVRSSHESFILTQERKTQVGGKSLDCTEVELLGPSNQFIYRAPRSSTVTTVRIGTHAGCSNVHIGSLKPSDICSTQEPRQRENSWLVM